ncbi:hypothetical protein AB0C76_26575 [Kitasatospora sp. NPDC048722]|uniref:hypothetical protein n=1 Tax=Kitasatospora sp. NPDC048722 TaxID=3155639 RepID=UPI0033EBA8CA
MASKRPNFVQQARSTFLDAAAGVLVVRDQVVRADLGSRTPGEILDAVPATAPGTERVYLTVGAPWHDGAERYSTLKDAVAAWLNTPSERWATATGSGRTGWPDFSCTSASRRAATLRPPCPTAAPSRSVPWGSGSTWSSRTL